MRMLHFQQEREKKEREKKRNSFLLAFPFPAVCKRMEQVLGTRGRAAEKAAYRCAPPKGNK
jgi:hypothetical protein